MNNPTRLLLLIAAILCLGQSYIGYSIYQEATVGTFSCLKQGGSSFVIIQAQNPSGGLNKNALFNLKYAKMTNNISSLISMFPCPSKDPSFHINIILNELPSDLYMVTYLRINKASCNWTAYSPQHSCLYLRDLADQIWSTHRRVGFWTTREDWEYVFKTDSYCATLAENYHLIYGQDDHQASFEGYKAFGGWKTPEMKQYVSSTTVCDQTVSKFYRK